MGKDSKDVKDAKDGKARKDDRGQRFIDKIDFYFTIRNVACLTGYSGLNPEVNITGLDPGYEWFDLYPETRRYTLGVKLTF